MNDSNSNPKSTPTQAPTPKPAQTPQNPSRKTIFNEGSETRAVKTGGTLPPDTD